MAWDGDQDHAQSMSHLIKQSSAQFQELDWDSMAKQDRRSRDKMNLIVVIADK